MEDYKDEILEILQRFSPFFHIHEIWRCWKKPDIFSSSLWLILCEKSEKLNIETE